MALSVYPQVGTSSSESQTNDRLYLPVFCDLLLMCTVIMSL